MFLGRLRWYLVSKIDSKFWKCSIVDNSASNRLKRCKKIFWVCSFVRKNLLNVTYFGMKLFDYKLWLDVLQIADYTKSRNCYHQILFDKNFPSLLTQQKNGIDCRIHMLKNIFYQFSAIICRMSHIREGWLCHARIILSISFEFSAFLLMFAYVCSMYIQMC